MSSTSSAFSDIFCIWLATLRLLVSWAVGETRAESFLLAFSRRVKTDDCLGLPTPVARLRRSPGTVPLTTFLLEIIPIFECVQTTVLTEKRTYNATMLAAAQEKGALFGKLVGTDRAQNT